MESGIKINFAYRTFRWDSESTQKAHVHCVIVGFSCQGKENNSELNSKTIKFIVDENGTKTEAKNINGYLVDAPDIFIESRNKPMCNVPEIGIGNKPIDGGNYLFKPEEKDEFIKKEPKSASYFRPWYGSDEFINNSPRFCLWLGDCSPADLRNMPECLKRVENVRKFRLASKSEGTRKIADKPTRFHVENMPVGSYIIIPETSSERRRYVPMGFMSSDVLCSNAVRLIPNATLYEFGILTSSVHMAWMRAVCGRLEMRYSYSNTIVYNNFPWPQQFKIDNSKLKMENGKWTLSGEELPADKKELSIVHSQLSIINTAQAILDARAKYSDSSLADLYDETLMPPELRKAHQANDRAVMAAYGFSTKMTESECVAELFKMYESLTKSR